MHDPTEGGLATGLHELAFASHAGLRLDYDRVVLLEEGLMLCAEYGLDPLGAIASGGLIVAVDSAQADSLLHAYHAAQIRATCIGEVLPAEDGIYMIRGDRREELRRFDSDEIARIF